ncbi:methionine aminopeptidase 2 [Penicillium paradoxum]|uniref:methionine aminopeptidase 2 n=1 Tax=Penicillium paradoxum TaxID=176176 RepID=UPI002548F1A0|nr:methionine aminopeptidase 2 [Penicillium paradoxum]KAJ5793505.1 methionine aminopeptidase 2 [Penicillium paradoxum]
MSATPTITGTAREPEDSDDDVAKGTPVVPGENSGAKKKRTKTKVPKKKQVKASENSDQSAIDYSAYPKGKEVEYKDNLWRSTNEKKGYLDNLNSHSLSDYS